jgi:tRNA pseudouridine55 synthase
MITVSSSPSGMLTVYKPSGISSARVVALIKKILYPAKVGHCGTLDPRAEGVLMVCFGAATRMSAAIMDLPKTYYGVMRLGMTTDTGDLDGSIKSLIKPDHQSLEAMHNLCAQFTGAIQQIPPMYSAIKIKGRKMYELARQGITVERQPRTIHIYKLSIESINGSEITFRCSCSKGTYIRTLVEDMGRVLGCGAVLVSLVREEVGNYQVKDAIPLNHLMTLNQEQIVSLSISNT